MEPKSHYDSWHKTMAVAESDQEVPLYPWHRTVLKLLPDLSGKTVLEVGCGRGDFACLLGQKHPEAKIVGADFATTAIDYARAKLPNDSNVSFTVADAQNLPFSDGAFDFVISCECLEHVEDPQRVMSNIARCLRSGGEFVVTTENYFNGMLLAWINSWLRKKPFDSGSGIQPNENFFVFWNVLRMIEKAGLTITHMESNHFVWLLLPRFSPDTFFTEDFYRPLFKRLFRPFGRHFTYQGKK
jgi:ubiquinone/menaquinone biosynthesis C-methylase UbiE